MIILIIILFLIFTPKSFAKYIETVFMKGKTEIAKPIFIVQGTEISKINSINNVGYYDFIVKNYNNNEISEVGFKYTIEVVAKEDKSIKFELYKENDKIEIENLKTKKINIDADKKIEHKYKLKVIYDKTLNDIGKDILQEVQIKVHSEQEK